MTDSLLYTAQDGPEGGLPWLVLADKYHSLDDVRRFGEAELPADTRRIAVRGSRVQTIGGNGVPYGAYWHIGPVERPELSTFGDALFQIEIVLGEVAERLGTPVGLLGQGQGAVLAMVLGFLWPERVREITAIGAGFPQTLSAMPVTLQQAPHITVTLRDVDAEVLEQTSLVARELGASVAGAVRSS
ncbi:hypothetical protein [Pseudoroseicyclus sp. CXY001]|uniref:hypothetical protein n=1 Tax=Pseudoroseicyclus sp. CXY001 TaxID=3242492 RepID=UPI0035711179